MPVSLSALETALTAAWARKAPLHAACGAVRLLNASASGTPRLVFELYGKHGILYDYGAGLEDAAGTTRGGDSLRAAASRWVRTFGWESVSLLDRSRAGEAERAGNFALAGEPPENLTIVEDGQPFRVEPRHPRNVGLFLDTRELRRALRAGSGGARVLNLFCYTGSLGLAALFGNGTHGAGGAAEVVQVDVSARYLGWGRENLRLAGLPEDRCRFVTMDAERYLDWAAKKDLRFDRILLDPPVFARFQGKNKNDGKVFRFEDDYFRLAAKAAERLSPGGALVAVTNYAGIRPAAFAATLAETLDAGGMAAAPPRRIPLPEDFDLAEDAEELPEGNAMIFEILRD
jgi:23S rRNA (cytosine1962-C5)-methyltransferase